MSKNLNGVIRTTQAILVTLFFLQLKYNESISKCIIFFGHLTFGVYLIHTNHNVIKNYIIKLLDGQPNNLTNSEVIKMIILKSINLFLKCNIIEYLRYLLFTMLKIRKICSFIEKIVFKFIS
jgi:ABC-type Mn2+/Zn2+ transport system permease subunit